MPPSREMEDARATARGPLRLVLLLLAALSVNGHVVLGGRGFAPAAAPPQRAAAAQMGLMNWLGTVLYERDVSKAVSRPGAGKSAASASMSRLKVVLAHDRTGLDEITMAKIRNEIQAVVAKYVIVNDEDVQFDMRNDDELTLVTATFPLAGPRAIAGGISAEGPTLAA